MRPTPRSRGSRTDRTARAPIPTRQNRSKRYGAGHDRDAAAGRPTPPAIYAPRVDACQGRFVDMGERAGRLTAGEVPPGHSPQRVSNNSTELLPRFDCQISSVSRGSRRRAPANGALHSVLSTVVVLLRRMTRGASRPQRKQEVARGAGGFPTQFPSACCATVLLSEAHQSHEKYDYDDD